MAGALPATSSERRRSRINGVVRPAIPGAREPAVPVIASPDPILSDPVVALYAHARANQATAHLSLPEVYRRIQAGTWAQPVAYVRQCRQALDVATDPTARETAERTWKEAKANLPAVTLSADGQTRARDVALADRGLVPSGRLQIDLDLHGEPVAEWERLWSILRASPHIEALWRSPSGDGLKGAIVVAGAGDADRPAEAFATVDRWLLATTGRANDPAVKDPQRLCFVSHDPDLHHHPAAVELVMDAVPDLAQLATPGPVANAAPAVEPAIHLDPMVIPNGSRNQTLARYAGWLRRCGLGAEEITASLLAINLRRCQPPLEAAEVRTIATSIARYDPDQVTIAVIEDWAATMLAGPRRLAIERIDRTPEQAPDWLWPGYLLRGSTAVVGGRQGSSKGLFTMDLAARLTRGDVMPDGSGGGAPCNVLIVAREDDAAMALRPRLRVAGADPTRIFWSYGDFTDGTPIPTMAEAATLIAAEVRANDIGLVIIDPLGAWVEEDGNNGQQIRAVIDPMNRVVRETGCAVIFVAHLRKAQAEDPMDAFAGSVQVTAACRTAILISPSQDWSERLVRVVKTNFRRPAGALFYHLKSVSPNPDEPPVLVWRLASDDELTSVAARPGSSPILPVATVLEHLTDAHRPLKEAARAIHLTLLAQYRGLTVQAVVDALLAAVAQGLAHEGEGRRGVRTIGRQTAPAVDTAMNRAIAYWEEHPESSVRDVARAVNCCPALAGRARRLVSPVSSEVSTNEETPPIPEETESHGHSGGLSPTPMRSPLGGAERDRRQTQPDDEIEMASAGQSAAVGEEVSHG